ncbi:helix-turn-helix domain-containing protein [Paenibacillus sp. HJGM_3]|uniref:helix-turn-helix domain-containing protein n=1 Tax=Paenibacillus sp. HJGM_3 TaxID=3379816 RepID=UPI003859125F
MLELVSVYFDDMHPDWQKEEAATLTDILILTVQGQAVYIVDGETVLLEKGDFLYIPKGVLRAGHNAPEGPHQKYSVHFHLESPGPFPAIVPASYGKVRTRNLDYMKQRFTVLAQHWFRRKKHDEVICTGIAMELLGYYAQDSAEDRFASIKLRLMREVQDYILEHYREPIRIGELAELVDRAPNYVTQAFKEVTGMTPITYLHQVRVHSARDLMLNTKLTIGDVADYLGYSDQAHFNRVFKKIMGYPPSSVQREVLRIQP